MFGYLIAAGVGFFAAKYLHHKDGKAKKDAASAAGGVSLKADQDGNLSLNVQKPADNAAQTK